MNPLLAKAMQSFRGQTVKVDAGGFDNSPLPEGIYTLQVVDSKVKESTDKAGVLRPKHYQMWKIMVGDSIGRNVFPFSPWLDDANGVMSMARTVRQIKGDVVPGEKTDDGQFILNLADFVAEADSHAASLIGEVVEARCVNQKVKADGSHLRDDGTPRQNWYLNRALGKDAEALKKPVGTPRKNEVRKPSAPMNVNRKKVRR
jgi:hypothetical protein